MFIMFIRCPIKLASHWPTLSQRCAVLRRGGQLTPVVSLICPDSWWPRLESCRPFPNHTIQLYPVCPALLLHASASSFHFYRPHLKETRGPLTNSESWWARCGQQLASVLPGSWSGQLARKIRFGKQFCPNASKGHRKTTHWHPLSFSWNFHDLSREKRDERVLVMVIPPAAFVVHLTSVSSLPCAHVHYLCTWDRDRGLYLYELTHWCFF